ncbi:hypothetical protein Vadar_028792 [Vaccinium darrowii]|uniref:Uncharacterized protein n=1 Tax=Vaccinium darrowii TaxID=229202 RepID=A0ACB7Z6W9_9ERIC|nr:hypothetical protein Vadar_028792 [Vaccinium darrowii]
MSILYSMVARGSVVLAEFSATTTNANATARQLLERKAGGIGNNNNDSNASYSHDRYIFHVKKTDGVTVVCMAEDSAGRRIPFAFLEDIHQRFVRTYGRAILSAPAYAMNDEFSRILSQQIDHYNNDPNADRINRLKGEMSQVRVAMIDNINKVLERGDRLAILVDKTATLQGNTFRFRRQSRNLRNAMWWRNVKLTFTLVSILVVIIYVLIAFLCDGRIPFAFLEDIHQRFVRTYGRAILSAPAYAMNDEFSRILSQQIDHYNNDPNADRINRLKGEMSQVRVAMIDNINKVLERGDRLAILVDKTATLQGNTFRFRRQSRNLRNAMWWRNVKLTFTLVSILVVIVYVLIAFLCDGPLLRSCLK